MRFKELLVMVTVLLFTALAIAAGPELKNVKVTNQDGTTVVALETLGAFTHSEYRPQASMVLVDLPGLSAATLKDREQTFDSPGVKGYRVLEYKSVSGVAVTRVEIKVAEVATLKVVENNSGLRLYFKADAAGTPPSSEALSAPTALPRAAPSPAPESAGRPATIRKVSVVRTSAGLAVEIDGAKTARTLRLSGPDRLVIDIPNSVPVASAQTITVNEPDLKSIRIARYQKTPPVTRVVLDLTGPREFSVSNREGKLAVTLLPPKTAEPEPARLASVIASPTAPPISLPPPPSAPLPVNPVPAVVNPVPAVANSVPAASNSVPAASNSVAAEDHRGDGNSHAPAAMAPSKVEAQQAPGENKGPDYVFVEPAYAPRQQAQLSAPAPTPEEAAVIVAKNQPPDAAQTVQAPPVSAPAAEPAVNLALEQQQARANPLPVQPTRKYTGEPISVNLKDVDLKDFFRLIHEISGLNLVLDPNVHGTLTLVLDDVPWDQALDVVLQNNGLARQLDGNVLRIATLDTFRREAIDKRAQAEAQALAVDKVTVTRFLSYAHAKDLIATVKKLLSTRGDVFADERTNALVISDIPSVIPQLDRLLTQLDRKTLEVDIEARVVAATRNFARQLGAQVGFGVGNSVTAIGGNNAVGTSSIAAPGVTNPQYFITGTNQIPLFSNLGVTGPTSGIGFVNATNNYRLDILLSAAESRGLAKVLSRPHVITQNNITAVIRQGVSIPVVTAAQLGGPPTVSYVAAMLRLTVTPQITIENTIFLAVDVENTTPDFSQAISGNPTLVTQQATTQVLVTDGGTVVIGGVIQTQNSINIQQVPWLGSIPIFGNLFKNRSVSTSTQELIFFLSPKIIQT